MPLPALLITGFLGAGKTSLINRILDALKERPERVALLINEFGDTGIDGRLINSSTQDLYEVNRGSIFCVCVRDEFVAALNTIAEQRDRFDFVIIEATGIAETRNLNVYLDEAPLNGIITVSKNLCVVDARNFHKIYSTLRAAREQVLSAGTVLINKVNLVDEELVLKQEKLIRELNTEAEIFRWDGGPVELEDMLPDKAEKLFESVSNRLLTLPPTGMISVSATADGIMDMDKLRTFTRSIPGKLYRAKGIVRTANGPVVVEYTPSEWSDSPYLGTDTIEQNVLVIIADTLDEEYVVSGFNHCVE